MNSLKFMKSQRISLSQLKNSQSTITDCPIYILTTCWSLPICLDELDIALFLSHFPLPLDQSCNKDLRRFFQDDAPSAKKFLSSDARFTALPSIIDSSASPPPQGKILALLLKENLWTIFDATLPRYTAMCKLVLPTLYMTIPTQRLSSVTPMKGNILF